MKNNGNIFKYILKKLLQMIPMLVVISFLIFVALKAMPIDPINYLLPPGTARDPQLIAELRARYGLDDPIFIQYGRWISQIVKGDFGYSIINGQPIKDILAQKLPATVELALASLIISSVLGILLGILSAVNQNGPIDYIARVIGVIGQSIPEFLFGIVLISVFALSLGWFPVGGRNVYGMTTFWDRLKT